MSSGYRGPKYTAAVGIDAGDQAYALNIRGVAFEGDDAAPVDLSFLQVLPIDFVMVVVGVVDVVIDTSHLITRAIRAEESRCRGSPCRRATRPSPRASTVACRCNAFKSSRIL